MPKKLPSIEYLHKVLRYDLDTGFLYWRERTPDTFPQKGVRPSTDICANWNARWSGKRAFTQQDGDGYHQGFLNHVMYKAAHVAWAMCKGVWPRDTGLWVDHINNVRSDNRITNLQLVTPSQNARKRVPSKSSVSNCVGVSFDTEFNKWRARITVDGRRVHLGRYASLEEAVSAREAVEKENGYVRRTRVSVLGSSTQKPAP